MRKVLSPQRDVLGLLARSAATRASASARPFYLRDVYDHLVRINESIEANRDLLGNALDAYLSAVGQRTNEIMKDLTHHERGVPAACPSSSASSGRTSTTCRFFRNGYIPIS